MSEPRSNTVHEGSSLAEGRRLQRLRVTADSDVATPRTRNDAGGSCQSQFRLRRYTVRQGGVSYIYCGRSSHDHTYSPSIRLPCLVDIGRSYCIDIGQGTSVRTSLYTALVLLHPCMSQLLPLRSRRAFALASWTDQLQCPPSLRFPFGTRTYYTPKCFAACST